MALLIDPLAVRFAAAKMCLPCLLSSVLLSQNSSSKVVNFAHLPQL